VRTGLKRLSTPGAILCYHSVTSGSLPAEGRVQVSLDSLLSAIHVARLLGEIVPLTVILDRHSRGRSVAGLVALTFDDAYAALNGAVLDAIVSLQVPLTVFVVAGAASDGRAFWWDRLDDLFPLVSPERWHAFEQACGLTEAYRTGQPAGYGPLRPLRQFILSKHTGRWPMTLEPELGRLEEEAGFRTLHRSMSFDELTHVAALPGIHIGVHTMTHPVLPFLPDDELKREVADCYSLLRERVPGVLPVLAVPYGLYDRRTLNLARDAGMVASLTVQRRTLRKSGLDAAGLHRWPVDRQLSNWKLLIHLTGALERWRDWTGGAMPQFPELPSERT
jgi:peptidoglycan/xylan/chitin deacetylase (PgdA/CDA1 family)